MAVRPIFTSASAALILACVSEAGHAPKRNESHRDLGSRCFQAVRAFADTMIEHGTDRYGPVKTPMFMAMLDIETHAMPTKKVSSPKDIRLRWGDRCPNGVIFSRDQHLLRCLYQLSKMTDDSEYERAADAYVRYYLANVPDGKSGFFYMGEHAYYNAVTDRGERPTHEFEHKSYLWERMYAVNPQAVMAEALATYKWHIHEYETWRFDRHANCKGARSGGAMPWICHAADYGRLFAFLYTKTKERKFLEWAKALQDKFWEGRSKLTQLPESCPGYYRHYLKRGPNWAAFHRGSNGNTTGYIYLLARLYQVAPGELPELKERAVTYLVKFDEFHYDPKTDDWFETVDVDGKPYYIYRKYHTKWEYGAYGGTSALVLGAAASAVYEISRDPRALAVLRKVADYLIRHEPTEVATAGGYGRGIWLLLDAYQFTDDGKYLDAARTASRQALDRLFANGLFRFQAGYPLYDNHMGTDVLPCALLRMAQVERGYADEWRDVP